MVARRLAVKPLTGAVPVEQKKLANHSRTTAGIAKMGCISTRARARILGRGELKRSTCSGCKVRIGEDEEHLRAEVERNRQEIDRLACICIHLHLATV